MLEFYPNNTPSQMLRQGVFGGSYFGDSTINTNNYDYSDLFKSFDPDISQEMYLGSKYSRKVNKFKVHSGMSYEYWKGKGWMNDRDPYGAFEWYCKYFIGIRGEDDDRQIRRWQDFAGVKGRWRNNIYKKIYETGDWHTSPRIQQSLLHWFYTVNEEDYQLWKVMTNKIYKQEEWCEYGGLPSPNAYQ